MTLKNIIASAALATFATGAFADDKANVTPLRVSTISESNVNLSLGQIGW
jgi:hypothetical protein